MGNPEKKRIWEDGGSKNTKVMRSALMMYFILRLDKLKDEPDSKT